MSGAKSILEIDLKDEKWQAFQEQFKKYSDALGAMPAGWGKVGQSIGGATEQFHELVRASQITAAATLATAANQERLLLAMEASNPGAERLERTTKGIARNIFDSTASLLKWTGIIGGVSTLLGGLLGAGGIWGLERLAGSAGAMRRGALGLGVSPGDQQAFGINYGRFVDPGNTLESVANAQTDITKRWAFNALGIQDYQNKDPATLAGEVVNRAKSIFDRNPTQQNADAFGLTQFFSLDELRRLHNTSQGELDEAGRNYGKDRAGLGLDPNMLRGWQDFTQQMSRAGQTIENTFITGLVPLAPQLADLSMGFTDVVAAFLKAPEVKELMGQAAAGLEVVAAWFKSGQFPWNDTKGTPVIPADEAAHPTELGRWLYRHFDRLRDPLAGFGMTSGQNPDLNSWLNGGHSPTLIPSDKTAWYVKQAAFMNGVPRDFAQSIFQQENGLNADGSARISKAGAIGAGQLMPGTAQQLGVNPFDTSDNISGSIRYMKKLLDKYNGDELKAAAAYNWGSKHVDDDIAAHGDAWRKYAPAETQHYVTAMENRNASPRDGNFRPQYQPPVKIDIHNNTGGSAVVSASQAAAG